MYIFNFTRFYYLLASTVAFEKQRAINILDVLYVKPFVASLSCPQCSELSQCCIMELVCFHLWYWALGGPFQYGSGCSQFWIILLMLSLLCILFSLSGYWTFWASYLIFFSSCFSFLNILFPLSQSFPHLYFPALLLRFHFLVY